MADFLISYKKTAAYEGGYSNDPADRGKETVFGISRAAFPSWPGWEKVDQMKLRYGAGAAAVIVADADLKIMVIAFYRQEFWDKLQCSNMPQEIADELYDTSVNMGRVYGVKCLQRALNKLNRNQADYPDLKVDGLIGPGTLSALNAYLGTSRFGSRSAGQLTRWILKWMNYFQLERYNDLSDLDPRQEKFIPGWTERG